MPSDPSPHDADHWYRRGADALAQDDLAQAEAALWACLAEDGDHAAALHLLGRLRERQGDVQAALALQRQSWRLAPSLGWNAFAVAELLSREQHFGAAAAAYRAAQEALPEQDWIAALIPQMRHQEGLHLFDGERLGEGFSNTAYRVWCQGFEPALQADPGMPDSLPPDWHLDLSPQSLLRPGTLAWLRSWLAGQGGDADLLTCDEDLFDAAGRRQAPWFKPGWVPESFWSTPWLGSGAFWRISWLQRQGLWPPPTSGAAGTGGAGSNGRDALARWRWQLQALEHHPRITHMPRVLIHRRTGDASGGPGGPRAPAAALAEALAAHLHRCGEARVGVEPLRAGDGSCVAYGRTAAQGAPAAPSPEDQTTAPEIGPPMTWADQAGTDDPCFRLIWAVPRSWRLSVVVLSRDRPDLLQRCLSSVEASAAVSRRSGLDLEWILVDNGSRLEATAALLRHWRQRPGSRLHVLPLDQPFNWSLLNNRAAATSRAELLLFLNNDVEAPAACTDSGWLGVMAGQALRPAIGAVGARLLYPDGSLQHAGLLPPLGQGCEHPYRHLSPTRLPHRGRAGFLTGWPAVTGACLMVRRALWQRSGGFDPALPVEGNDVDFCLRLGHLGLRHVVCPEATLLHHEGASRDLNRSATWGPAQALLQRRWPGGMAQADPWWPRACSLETTDGRPRELAGRGWP